MTYPVLLVEPHQLMREGLCALLAQQADFTVQSVAHDGRSAVEAAVARTPALVLMDIALGGAGGLDGIETLVDLRRRCPQAGVVVLTALRTHHHVREALSVGANGYVVKDTSFDEVLTALRSVARGRTYLSPEVSGQVVRRYLDPKSADGGADSQLDQLTRRERSIMRLIAEGLTNRAAAQVLHLSPKTVEKHRASLMRKLGLRSVAELAVLALEAGFIERPNAFGRGLQDGEHTLARL